MTAQVTEEQIAKIATAPRVTKEQIDAMAARIQYVVVGQPADTTSTFVHAYLDGKFFLASGFSGCVDAANFNAELGEQLARGNAEKAAIGKLWELAGYELYAKHYAPTDHVSRMQIEFDENMLRLTKLTQFLSNGQPAFINDEDWQDLNTQFEYQSLYVAALKKRLDKAVDKQKAQQ